VDKGYASKLEKEDLCGETLKKKNSWNVKTWKIREVGRGHSSIRFQKGKKTVAPESQGSPVVLPRGKKRTRGGKTPHRGGGKGGKKRRAMLPARKDNQRESKQDKKGKGEESGGKQFGRCLCEARGRDPFESLVANRKGGL